MIEGEGPQLRVLGPDRTPQEAEAERRCWHCGGSADRRPIGEGWESTSVALHVSALVPAGATPEAGRVCLACLTWEIARADWSALETDLGDDTRRREVAAEAGRRREAEAGG